MRGEHNLTRPDWFGGDLEIEVVLNGVSLARFGAEIVFLKRGDLGGGKQLERLIEEIKNKRNQKQLLAISRITVMQNSKSGSKKFEKK